MKRGLTGHYVPLPSAAGENARAFVPNPLPPAPPLELDTEIQELIQNAMLALGRLDGLTTVMLKMLNLVGPASVYLGQRHAQQVVILRRMMNDLFLNIQLVICPTVREADGLALSSANALLSIEERHAATCLFAALKAARAAYDAGERSAEVLRARMTDVIAAESMARPDYISVADAGSLAELQRVSGPALALVAVWIGRTRLTDNMPLAWDVA